jgi:hypothetical protein
LRQFASGGFRIWNLSREAKLVYTGFALFSLLGLASSLLLYEDMVGDVGARGYYAGEAATVARSAPSPSPSDGPRLELPLEPRRPLKVAMPYRKLLEVTHFHLFTVPVFLLIVAHLFMLTGLSSSAKAAWIIGGWAAALLHLAAPWLVRYGPAGGGWIYALSGTAMAVTTTMLTVYPIVVMWRGGPKE